MASGDTGWIYPDVNTIAQADWTPPLGSTGLWSDIERIAVEDSLFAFAHCGPDTYLNNYPRNSRKLQWKWNTAPLAAIPPGATVTGIEFQARFTHEDEVGLPWLYFSFENIELQNPAGGTLALGSQFVTTSDVTITKGGAGQLFGLTPGTLVADFLEIGAPDATEDGEFNISFSSWAFDPPLQYDPNNDFYPGVAEDQATQRVYWVKLKVYYDYTSTIDMASTGGKIAPDVSITAAGLQKMQALGGSAAADVTLSTAKLKLDAKLGSSFTFNAIISRAQLHDTTYSDMWGDLGPGAVSISGSLEKRIGMVINIDDPNVELSANLSASKNLSADMPFTTGVTAALLERGLIFNDADMRFNVALSGDMASDLNLSAPLTANVALSSAAMTAWKYLGADVGPSVALSNATLFRNSNLNSAIVLAGVTISGALGQTLNMSASVALNALLGADIERQITTATPEERTTFVSALDRVTFVTKVQRESAAPRQDRITSVAKPERVTVVPPEE